MLSLVYVFLLSPINLPTFRYLQFKCTLEYLLYLLGGRVTSMSTQGSQTRYVSFVYPFSQGIGVEECGSVGMWADMWESWMRRSERDRAVT